MQNPFEEINTRLDKIENAILALESKIKIHDETALKKVVDDLKTTTLSSAQKRYLDSAQAAKYIGITLSSIYQYIYRIPHIKKEGKLYFLNTDLDQYLKNKKLRKSNQ